jgi:hypothetical protein
MDQIEIRMECLKLAYHSQRTEGQAVEAARQLASFVLSSASDLGSGSVVVTTANDDNTLSVGGKNV